MKYHFRIHEEDDGFWAECIELEGCLTQADTLEELHENMQEALSLYLSEDDDFNYLSWNMKITNDLACLSLKNLNQGP